MAHNSNNEDSKIIILVEELEKSNAKQEMSVKPNSAVCSILKDIQYTSTSSIVTYDELEQKYMALKPNRLNGVSYR